MLVIVLSRFFGSFGIRVSKPVGGDFVLLLSAKVMEEDGKSNT